MNSKLDDLSDEFNSTFVKVGPSELANMFHENERDEVERLVKKHMGATKVSFTKDSEFVGKVYALWYVRYSCE